MSQPLTILVLLLGGTASRAAAQALPAPLDTAEIRTAGTGHRSVRPDRATLSATVIVEDSTPARATRQLAARVDSLRRALRALATPGDSITVGSRVQWWGGHLEALAHAHQVPASDPRFGLVTVIDTTYRLRDFVELEVPDFAKLPAVVQALLALHITELSDVRYTRRDLRAAEDEALQEATTRTQRQAQLMAEASGGKLGRVITLSTATEPTAAVTDFTIMTPQAPGQGGRLGSVGAPMIDVSVTVYGRWQLLPRP